MASFAPGNIFIEFYQETIKKAIFIFICFLLFLSFVVFFWFLVGWLVFDAHGLPTKLAGEATSGCSSSLQCKAIFPCVGDSASIEILVHKVMT